jgi:hypothetical protein
MGTFGDFWGLWDISSTPISIRLPKIASRMTALAEHLDAL